MWSISSFQQRLHTVAPWLMGSVFLHALIAAWALWHTLYVEEESALTEAKAVQIGLIAPTRPVAAPSSNTATPSRTRPQPRALSSTEATPPTRTMPVPTPVEPTSITQTETPSPPTTSPNGPDEFSTLSSLSPESMPDAFLPDELPEPLVPGEFSITRSPASAYLHYDVSVQRRNERLNGSGNLLWEINSGQYRVEIVARAIVQVSKQVSEGRWQPPEGLRPQVFTDQRGLRSENRVPLERHPQVGVQDYASLIMQLSSLLASDPPNFYVGTGVRFLVVDNRKSREMIFRLREPDLLNTGLGRLEAWRFSYEAPTGSADRNIDIWFAREADWLPVRLRFADSGRGEVIEFTLQRRERI